MQEWITKTFNEEIKIYSNKQKKSLWFLVLLLKI